MNGRVCGAFDAFSTAWVMAVVELENRSPPLVVVLGGFCANVRLNHDFDSDWFDGRLIACIGWSDHILALAPIAVNEPKRARRLRCYLGTGSWCGGSHHGGLGHLGQNLDRCKPSVHGLTGCGFLLIGMAIWAIWVARLTVHSHDHDHDGEAEHAHMHVHMEPRRTDGRTSETWTCSIWHWDASWCCGGWTSIRRVAVAGAAHWQAVLYLGSYFIAAITTMSGVGMVGQLAKTEAPEPSCAPVRLGSCGSGWGIVWLEQGLKCPEDSPTPRDSQNMTAE